MCVASRGAAGLARYRPEIDGLRAIAVLAVVGYHARLPGFGGGYLGVDVFFVVSGYLITQLIREATAAGDFSIARFYERRVRRLTPALFAVLAASSAAAMVLLPHDLKRYGASLVSVVAFASNLLFWRQSGYFSPQASATPLLHTWSLAVEEQFYLAFPLCLLLLQRAGRRAVAPMIALIMLASLAYGLWAARHDPNLAFYSPFSRAWELMLGALLACEVIPAPTHRLANEALVALGLALIAYAVVGLADAAPPAGLQPLAPCLGAAMILQSTASPRSVLVRLLSVRPLVATGLASYSIYLWHWPLIVFGGYYVLDPHWAGPVRIAMALAAFPIAFASWRYIERPFRGPHGLLSRRALFATAAALSLAFGLIGGALYALGGLPQRFDPTVRRLDVAGEPPSYPCANQAAAEIVAGSLCMLGDRSAPPAFAIWGNSHAGMYATALDALARQRGVAGYTLTTFGCPPLVSVAQDRACQTRNALILQALEARHVRAVILSAHWEAYFAMPGAAPGLRNPSVHPKHGLGYTPQFIRAALEATAAPLRRSGILVYLAEDVPNAPLATPDRLAKAYVLGRQASVEPRSADYERANLPFHTIALDLQRQGLLQVLSPAAILCGTSYCRVTDGPDPIYFDPDHLNARGALLVSPSFEPVLDQLKR